MTTLLVGGTGHLGPGLIRLLSANGRGPRVLSRDPGASARSCWAMASNWWPGTSAIP